MLLLSEADLATLIDVDLALACAEEAYRLHCADDTIAPGRIDLRNAAATVGLLTLATVAADGLAVVKSNLHVRPEPGAPGVRRHASMVSLWDTAACRQVAAISGLAFNRARTAAGFAVACRTLAPSNSRTLAVFGVGAMAPETVRMICAVRAIEHVTLVGRGPERAAALAAQLAPRFPGVRIAASTDPRSAAEADIVVAVTSADSPVFPGDAVRSGALVVLGGANRPTAREADDTLIARAAVYCDDLEGCVARAGDLALPLAAGKLERCAIVGELGRALGSPPPEAADVLVFKSIGVATQDMVLAKRVVEKARAAGVGVEFDVTTGAVAGAASRRSGASAVA